MVKDFAESAGGTRRKEGGSDNGLHRRTSGGRADSPAEKDSKFFL